MEQSCRPRAAGRSGLPPPEPGVCPPHPSNCQTERLMQARLWAVQQLLREERPYARRAAGPGMHPDGAKRRVRRVPW